MKVPLFLNLDEVGRLEDVIRAGIHQYKSHGYDNLVPEAEAVLVKIIALYEELRTD